MSAHAQIPVNPVTDCWGCMRNIGYCYKKPRPGKLTCSWHRKAETHAQQLKLTIVTSFPREANVLGLDEES